MSADSLLASLRAAGLHVVEQPRWKTRGKKWAESQPLGVMQHHTAPPNPYPIRKLYGLRIKANMATHEDGILYLIAYRACNYSSGPGSSAVLRRNVRRSVAPLDNAKPRGLHDDMGGNRYFWNYENSHPGDGSLIPQIQLDTIIESTRIVLEHFGLNAEQVISHAEWTRRKLDPYWNGDRRVIDQIRADIKETDVELSPEAQRFYEEMYKAIGSPEAKPPSPPLEPPTNQDALKALVQDLRDRKN